MTIISWNELPILERIRKGVMRGVVRGTEEARNEAIRLILQTSKSGRLYGTHRASAPGEAPASDTGRLVNSISTVYDETDMKGSLQVSAKYGLFLEYGTSRMEARPFLRPAMMNKAAVITKIIADEINAALRA